MPIDLRKYHRRYIEIFYGSKKLVGKLEGNTLYCLGNFSDGHLWEILEINEQTIVTIKDVTEDLYTDACDQIAGLEESRDYVADAGERERAVQQALGLAEGYDQKEGLDLWERSEYVGKAREFRDEVERLQRIPVLLEHYRRMKFELGCILGK